MMAGNKKTKTGWVCQDRKPISSQASYLLRLQSMQESFAANEEKNLRNTVDRFSSHKSLHKYRNAFDTLGTTESRSALVYGRGAALPKLNRVPCRDYIKEKGLHTSPETWYHISSSNSTTAKKDKKKTRPSIPALTEKEMARIISSMQVVRQYPDANYGIIPNKLPTIPNVGHKSALVQENRIRALLTEESVSETPNIRKQRPSRKIHKFENTSISTKVDRGRIENVIRVPTLREPTGLHFDVDPMDKEVFAHAEDVPQTQSTTDEPFKSEKVLLVKVQPNGENDQGLPIEGLPDAPPNSRPDSLTPRTVVEVVQIPDVVIETDPDSADQLPTDFGELSRAMTKLNVSQSDLEKLKDEVHEIAQLNEVLEKD